MSQSQNSAGDAGRRGANLYLVASAVAQGSALLRYVVLARMLGPEQLGLAATLVLTAAFFDYISDTGSDRFLVQDRDGDLPSVQKLVHLVYIGRGAMIAAALVIFAWPIAVAYHTPRLALGLMILALSPLILGFLHLDIRRLQRHLDFRADALCTVASEIAGLAATAAAAALTHAFTAILYGLITRAIVMVGVSHLQRRRRYEIGLSREHAARLARFAAPLMLNGVLLFFATQGDRALVGNRLGFVALGRYSAILLLIYYPAAMLMRYIQAMYLPLLSRGRDDPVERARVGNIMGGQILMLGLGMSAGFAVIAPYAVKFLYGARFSEAAMTVALIGILQTSRFLLVFPTVVALSVGRSGAALAVNVVRLVAYPAAFVGGFWLGGLPGVLSGFIFGELVAHGAGLALLNQGFRRPLLTGFHRLAVFALAAAAILGMIFALERHAVVTGVCIAGGTALLLGWTAGRERLAINESLAFVGRIAGGLFRKPRRA